MSGAQNGDRRLAGIRLPMKASIVTGCLLVAVTAGAQTRIDLRTQVKSVDFSSADSTLPSQTGTQLPATCNVGQSYFKTDATPGQNWYLCLAGNQWTVQGGALPAVTGNAGTVLFTDGSSLFWKGLGGDISGSPNTVTLNGLLGRPLSAAAPQTGQTLAWSGTAWAPQNAAVASVFGRTGTITAQSGDYGFSQIGGTVASSQLPGAGGDLAGSLAAATVTRLQGWPVGAAAPAAGQALMWSGTQWAPQNPAVSVASIFGRTGAVTAQSGDYGFAQIGGTVAGSQLPPAGGDLSGTLTAATVTKLQGWPMGATAPQSGQHLTWNGTQWAPENPLLSSVFGRSGAVTAQSGDYTFSQIGGTVASSQLPGAGGDLTGSLSAATVTRLQGSAVATATPQPGQNLTWTGTQWAPQNAAVPSVFGRAGAVTAQTGDYTFSQIGGTVAGSQLPAAGGDLSGTLTTATVTKLQGWAMGTAAPATGQVLAWNGAQWSPQNIASAVPSVFGRTGAVTAQSGDYTFSQIGGTVAGSQLPAAGGDLAGSLTAATVTRLQGWTVGTTAPATGQVMTWSGAQWAPANVAASMVAGGDLSGTLASATVKALQGLPVASGTPQSGQVMTWSGAQWGPENVAASMVAGGDLSGTLAPATVKALQGLPVASGTPQSGQVMTWTGTQWGPQSVTAGVSSVFGRTGTIAAQFGDYTAAQVTNAVDATAANSYVAGARQTFQGNTTTAGMRYIPSPLPGTPLAGDLAVDSGDSNKLKLYDGGSWVSLTPESTPANYAASFASQTTVTVPGTVHQLGTANLEVECFDSAVPANLVEPNTVTVNPTTYDVDILFAAPQSGYCVIDGFNGGGTGGSGSGSGGAVTSVFGRTGNVMQTTGDYSFSQISGTVPDAQVAAGVNASKIGGGTVTNLAFGYLANVTSDIQAQINSKASLTSAAGGDATGTLSSLTVQGLQNRSVANAVPADGQALVWSASLNEWKPATVSGSGGSGGGATMASQLGDFWVSLQSATVLAIGTGCTPATPCNASIGSQVYRITAGATATISGGNGMAYVYLDANGVLTVGHSMTVSCTGCTAVSGVVSFPADVVPLFTWEASNGAWITAGGTDLRGWLSGTNIQAGAGIVIVESGGNTTVAVDSAVVPTYLTASATLDFPLIAAGTCSADLTFPLTGASPGAMVVPGWPSGMEPGLTGTMRVSASGLVAVRLCALGAAVNPAAATFQAAIIQGN